MRLIFITNDPDIAKISEDCGVDWVLVDLEKIGKEARQSDRDTVKSTHHVADIPAVKASLNNACLAVRINPPGRHSRLEIEEVIEAGAEIIILPYFSTVDEAKEFIDQVARRAETCLLVETMQAVSSIREIVMLDGIDYIHIGLNDIHIQRGSNFMFEFLSDGLVDELAERIREARIPFGFGGVGRTDKLKPSGARILGEHIRLGSTGVILSRSFINPEAFDNIERFSDDLRIGVRDVRDCLVRLGKASTEYLDENRRVCSREIIEVAAEISRQ